MMNRRSFIAMMAVSPFVIKTKIPKIITQKNNNLTYNNTLHVLYIFEFATQTPFNIDEVRRASKITGLI